MALIRSSRLRPARMASGRGAGGRFGAGAGGADQAVGLGQEFDGEIAVARKEISLLLFEGDLSGTQAETAIGSSAQLDQAGEGRRQLPAQGLCPELGQAPLDAPGGGFEALPQRFQQGGVGDVEGGRQKLRGDGGFGPEFRQMAITGDLRRRKMPRARGRRLAEIAVAGHGVEQLVVDQWDQKARQLAAKRRQFLAPRPPQRGQLEALRHRGLDRLDTGDQRLAALADRPRARRVLRQLHQPRQLRLEGHAVPGDLAGDARQVAGRGRGGQARSGGDQGAALPRHREGGRDLGNAALVHPSLDVAHPVEGNPTD